MNYFSLLNLLRLLYDHLMMSVLDVPRAREKNVNSDVIGYGGVLYMSDQVYCILILLIYFFGGLLILSAIR